MWCRFQALETRVRSTVIRYMQFRRMGVVFTGSLDLPPLPVDLAVGASSERPCRLLF